MDSVEGDAVMSMDAIPFVPRWQWTAVDKIEA